MSPNVDPFPTGSILRTAWYDEIHEPGSYQKLIDDGWEPPGIICYKNLTAGISDDVIISDALSERRTIPFGTNGLFFVRSLEEEIGGGQAAVWCQVLWEEKLIWIIKDWLVLVKTGSGEANNNVVP